MPIESKEIIEFLGMKPEEVTDMKVLVDKFQSTFTRKDNVDDETASRITGAAFGKLTQRFKRDLNDIGIEMTESDVKDKRFEDVLLTGINKFKAEKSKFDSFVASKGDESKELKELQHQLAAAKSQYEEVNGKFTGLATEYETYKTTAANDLKTFKARTKVADIHKSKVDFADGVPELTRKGYFTTVSELYSPDYDEKTDNVYAIDNSTGKRIPGKVAGTDKLYEEVLPEVGIKAGVWKLNNHSKNQNQNQNIQERKPLINEAIVPKRMAAKPIS